MDTTRLPDSRGDGSAPATVGERQSAAGENAPILPPPADIDTPARRQAPATIPIAPGEWDARPSVERDRWVTRDELLSTSQHAIYGSRSPYARKRRHPLPQPRRFRKVPKWQSWTVLVLATIVSLVILFGAVRANPFGTKAHSPAATATPTIIHPPTATASPAKR